MCRILCICLTACLLVSCLSQRPIQDSDSPPIDAANPLEGTPVALAWSKNTQLMMCLDTGAVQQSVLFSSAVNSLKTRIRGKGTMRTAYLPVSLQQGAPPITEKQDVVMVDHAPYDGLLGWSCLRRFVWNINYPKQKHRFFHQLPNSIKRWHKLPLVANSDYPQIADKSGRKIIIDTGAPHAVYISKERWALIKQIYPDAFVTVYSGYSPAAGGFYAHECMLVKSFSIGAFELHNILLCESFANPEVQGIPNDIDIILGFGALTSRQFWLDGPGNMLYFGSTVYPTPLPNNFNLVGATFVQDRTGDGPLKAYVADWSPAWDAGLRTGDILVTLNGRKDPYPELIDYATCQQGAQTVVVVRRKNQWLRIQWTVPPLPEPGDYYPTPAAVTEQEFTEKLRQQEQQQNPPATSVTSSPAKSAKQANNSPKNAVTP